MYGHQDTRRKNNSNHTLKSVFNTNSHSSLLAALDKKRSDVSKDKVRANQMPEQDQMDLKGSATINFRNPKNAQNGQQQMQKANKQYYQLKINKKTSQSQHNNGIQINVNIQNMLPHNRKQQLNETHSDRSLSRKQKDSSKVAKKNKKQKTLNNTSALDDFECTEQLQFKAAPKTEKKIIQPLIEKNKLSGPLIKPKNPEISDWTQQVRQFEEKIDEIVMQGEAESVVYLDQRLICYQIDPLYIEKRQKNFTWTMRAMLMDWMVQLASEFKFKRQTAYIAITLVDNYFQSTLNLPKSDFQLIGAAALFIAAKMEEFEPLPSKQFSKSTKDRYTAEQIRSMQCRILKTLKYNLNPPTINMWANKLMQQWDLFLDSTPILRQGYFDTHSPQYFKKDLDSYYNFRDVMQILDCAILDIQTVQYKPKILVCSMIYLILGKKLGEFSKERILKEFPATSLFFLQETPFNIIFKMFIEGCLGLQMFELLPSVQYLATYFFLPLDYKLPQEYKNEDEVQYVHFEEFCSYQTYNEKMLMTVKKRFRGIY